MNTVAESIGAICFNYIISLLFIFELPALIL
jgi:hypothetical protein